MQIAQEQGFPTNAYVVLEQGLISCRFAHMIGTREFGEELYRISKDEHQCSHITREPLI